MNSFRIPEPPPLRATSATLADEAAVGVTPGHPFRDLDEGATLSEATAPPSLTLGQAPPVEPGQGFPGRARRSDQKAQQKAELAARKRQARADGKARKLADRADREGQRHRAKLARIERKQAERVRLADRVPWAVEPVPVHRSWWMVAIGVAVTAVVAVGTWRATSAGDTNFHATVSAPATGETETSGVTTSTFQLANPLAAVPFPLTARAARFIGGGRPPVAVTLGDGSRVSLSYPSLKAISEQMGSGPKDPCTLQLAVSADPSQALGLKVVTGTPDGVPLFDCAAPAAVTGGR